MPAKGNQVQFTLYLDSRHARAAVSSGNRHTIHTGQLDSRKRANCLRDFGGGDVFAFPAEGIADAIDKIEEAPPVFSHQVAGTDPSIARLEDVTDDLFV